MKNATNTVPTVTASNADIVLWEIPPLLYQKRDKHRSKASGVFLAEQMFIEAASSSKGRYAFTFPHWPKGKELWEVPDFHYFLEGLLWGQDPAKGHLTAYHAQRIVELFYDEDTYPEEEGYFGRHQLMALVFNLTRKQDDKTGEWLFDKKETLKCYQDILADPVGDAATILVSNLELIYSILQVMDGQPPFFLRDKKKGAFLLTRDGRTVLPLFRNADLANIFRKQIKVAKSKPVPEQLFEENLYLEFSCARFAGTQGVDLWLDDQTRHAIETFYRPSVPR